MIYQTVPFPVTFSDP